MTESRNVQRTTVHDSRRTDPLLTSELETIYFKIDCRYPEEIAMMCEISYDKGNQKDLNFKRKYLLPVSYLRVVQTQLILFFKSMSDKKRIRHKMTLNLNDNRF